MKLSENVYKYIFLSVLVGFVLSALLVFILPRSPFPLQQIFGFLHYFFQGYTGVVIRMLLLFLSIVIGIIIGYRKDKKNNGILETNGKNLFYVWMFLITILLISYFFTSNPTYRCGVDFFGIEEPRDNCYHYSGRFSEEKYCGKIINKKRRDSCYKDLAEYKKDFLICENVADSYMKDICKIIVFDRINRDSSKTIEYCSQFNKEIENWCQEKLKN